MVNVEPNVKLGGRFSVEETATLLGVHRNSILRYTNQGKLRFGVRKGNSRRFYTGAEILRFWRAAY